jgi:hypothetical protein
MPEQAQQITADDVRLDGELVLSDAALASLARLLVDAAIDEKRNEETDET